MPNPTAIADQVRSVLRDVPEVTHVEAHEQREVIATVTIRERDLDVWERIYRRTAGVPCTVHIDDEED